MTKEIVKSDLTTVVELLKKVLDVDDYKSIDRMGGLTNHTYHVVLNDDKEYVVRVPGEGTEEVIVRSDEKKSTKLACDLHIDAKCLFFGDNGEKVTEYILNAETMHADTIRTKEHIKEIADILNMLHSSNVDTNVPFEVFDMAKSYEKVIVDNGVPMPDDYNEVKQTVRCIKQEIDSLFTIKKVPCHNDALCENWVHNGKRMYLIDWEYAGMNDGMWDVADVSIEACLDYDFDKVLLMEYLHCEPTTADWKHFLASKIYVDYLWTLWAKMRVPYDGQSMEDWALERYTRLKNNIVEFKKY